MEETEETWGNLQYFELQHWLVPLLSCSLSLWQINEEMTGIQIQIKERIPFIKDSSVPSCCFCIAREGEESRGKRISATCGYILVMIK